MIQSYHPDLAVSAIRGWCLKYVDDAGNAPQRTATARYSWQVERNAGRIRTTSIPENVWVVGWLDFTSGQYQTYGHVFFMKRNGDTYSIYDSEVASGARRPYGSVAELLAWFGAYKPIYLGWSTDCDGRNYVKEGDEMVSDKGVEYLFRTLLGRAPDKNQKVELMKTYTFDGLEQWILSLPEYKDNVKLLQAGNIDTSRFLVYPWNKVTAKKAQVAQQLKPGIYEVK